MMKKRAFSLLCILVLLASSLVFRIAYLNNSLYAETASSQGARIIQVAETRGMIYDRNMEPLVNRVSHKTLVINPTDAAKTALEKCLDAVDHEAVREKLQQGEPFTVVCDSYTGSCGDILEFTSYDRYASSDNAVHVIGYTDGDGNGVSGLEKSFDSLMKENAGSIAVRYYASSVGTALSGKGFEIVDNNYDSAGGLVVTLDSRMQRICEDAMARNGIEKGAVVVLDAATSEILALASAPTFDRADLSSALTNDASPFVNRAISAYSVGSVFKPIVAIAAMEKNIASDTIFNCPGFVTVNGSRFNCHKKTGHGKSDMTAAIADSCNAYFIELGKLVGAENILMTASRLGLGQEIELCDAIISRAGILPSVEDIDSAAALANLSFGQGTLLATPLQIAAVYCAIANGGYYREPYLLKSIVDSDGGEVLYYKNEINNKVLTEDICKRISTMLKETVESGSGKLAKPMGMTAAGKTATAQTGWIRDGNDVVHTWFAGFYPAEEPKYTVVVFKEDGSTSSTDCAPVFRDIADAF